jgi:preprotein translocase YajC subunit
MMFFANFLLICVYLLPLVGLLMTYYFAIYMPAKIENDAKIFLWYSINIGDRILTKGGLVGTVFQKGELFLIISLFDGFLAEVALVSICEKL